MEVAVNARIAATIVSSLATGDSMCSVRPQTPARVSQLNYRNVKEALAQIAVKRLSRGFSVLILHALLEICNSKANAGIQLP